MNELPIGTVTFLFTDIEGSSRLWREHPEPMQLALARHDAILREAIKEHNGHVVKMRGDGAHAVFASAVDGVTAALSAQRVLANEDWPLAIGQIRVRMGLHTGHAQLRDADYFGQSVNQAARIQEIGHGGQVLLSQATQAVVRDLLPDDTSLLDLGEHQIRDFSRVEPVYQLTGPGMDRNFPPLKSLSQALSNLPAQPTRFIGREKELAALDELIANPDVRLVTIVAPGGMGKTRLSLATAERHLERDGSRTVPTPLVTPKHGVYFVALAPLNSVDQIAPAMAEALDFPMDIGGPQIRTRIPEQQILDYLSRKQMLIVMDNFEHLLDGVNIVADILQEAPGVQILATSRERLHLHQEQVYPLHGLEFPNWETPADAVEYTAVKLFLQSARRVQPGFELATDDLTYLTRICRLVGGMPLAVELAAGWVNMLSLADIAIEIQKGLDFLETDVRNVPERHQSMRAGQEVTEASLRLLGQMVSKSLLQYDRSRDRYQIHELLRQYGAEKLAQDSALNTSVCDRHSAYYCATTARSGVKRCPAAGSLG